MRAAPSVHAITSKISPTSGTSTGIEVLEADTFTMYNFQTLTGEERGRDLRRSPHFDHVGARVVRRVGFKDTERPTPLPG
ncbi:MAG: hypothetical protein BJ554DRAFT_7341 [Olpidium bornovanus]|uniref:Uncharacterized protein n=1 Tax=Olpidium bornovanus TaxID=278681 RepID=A0A8H7ZWT5_9FUNG|nr:MAG: hypothetical protein BJ554DRAFT_7341 [Olpidium bornovanus]